MKLTKTIHSIHFESLVSTNTWAKEHPLLWTPSGLTVVTACKQTGGRGRFNRQWISPPSINIYATFCFWLSSNKQAEVVYIPQLLAITCAELLEKYHFHPRLKWPNDILLNDKKVAGILCETIQDNAKIGIICGIGLNVNMPVFLLNQIDRPATSLLVEGGRPYPLAEIQAQLQNSFYNHLEVFLNHGFSPFFPLFENRFYYQKGQPIRFHNNQVWIEGTFEQLQPNGSITLRLPDNRIQTYYAGEFDLL